MTSKYTQAPWWFDGDEAIYHGDEPLGPEHHHENQFIAEISFHNGIEEGEANAKLISAAPEMLEALENCVDMMKSCGLHPSCTGIALEAILKAKGKQSA